MPDEVIPFRANESCPLRQSAIPMRCIRRVILLVWLLGTLMGYAGRTSGQVLDKQKALEAYTWWDNRDWDWYKANIPFFECPDQEIVTTWYYRWQLVTKHLT